MKIRFVSLLFLSMMAAPSAKATVLATDPADYVPLPSGTNLGLLYYQHSESTALYADGSARQHPSMSSPISASSAISTTQASSASQ